jgi:pyruvate/2-oxoglutarate/acetoin dehydrogenase E1 component
MGRARPASLLAAQQAEAQGISVAVVDLRTIIPYDWDTIAAYTQKTTASSSRTRIS